MTYNVRYEDVGLRDYKETWEYQEKIFNRIIETKRSRADRGFIDDEAAFGTLIFVEHPHVYTLGKSGSENNLLLDYIQLKARDASFYRIDRGGDITYHGPGQIVGYPIFDLERIGISLRQYVSGLEETVIQALKEAGISSSRLDGATGVWIDAGNPSAARKICAIGVKASRYVTMHGFALNVNTNLEYFSYINPCGFTDKGVTSIEKELGSKQDLSQIKSILRGKMKGVFNLEWINGSQEWKRNGL